MQEIFIYIDDVKLPVNPQSIKYVLPTSSVKYDLITKGEAEMLKGAKLAEISIEGYLPMQVDELEEKTPEEYIDKINSLVEEAKPVRLIYTGRGWDINMLVSLQDPEFFEIGGSFDVEYKIRFRKWVEISRELVKQKSRRENSSSKQLTKKSVVYTVKSGDNLSKIAKNHLGSQSKWKEIYAANKSSIKNPNLIYPGQELIIPGKGQNTTVNKITTKQRTTRQSATQKKKNTSSNTANNTGKPKYSGANDLQIGYGRS